MMPASTHHRPTSRATTRSPTGTCTSPPHSMARMPCSTANAMISPGPNCRNVTDTSPGTKLMTLPTRILILQRPQLKPRNTPSHHPPPRTKPLPPQPHPSGHILRLPPQPPPPLAQPHHLPGPVPADRVHVKPLPASPQRPLDPPPPP